MVGRAKAFGMKVVAFDIALTDELAAELGVTKATTLLEVARKATVVSVHLSANAETKGTIGEAFFEALAPGSTFINTSRAEVVNEAAMVRAIAEKQIRCGVDVYSDEPAGAEGSYRPAFVDEEYVVGTHHIGASTAQAQDAVSAEVVRVINTFAARGVPANAVNLCVQSPATCQLVVRHLDKVGVLAGVFDLLRRGEMNVQGMENIVFEGASAAVARIELDTRPSPEILEALDASNHIISVSLRCTEANPNLP
jgi:D-3-phosphoglycerate dehydrogenase